MEARNWWHDTQLTNPRSDNRYNRGRSNGRTFYAPVPASRYVDREEIQSRIYRGELTATDADGVTTMRDLQ